MLIKETQIDRGQIALSVCGRVWPLRIARSICHSPRIISLDLSYGYVSDNGIKQIARALPRSSLTSLNVSNNNIGLSGIRFLAKTLKKCPRIYSLNVSTNSFEEEGAMCIVNAIHSLTHLSLAWNMIGPLGVRDVITALQTSSLEVLHIEQGVLATAHVLDECLIDALVNCPLRELTIDIDNSPFELKNIQRAIITNTRLLDCRAFLKLSHWNRQLFRWKLITQNDMIAQNTPVINRILPGVILDSRLLTFFLLMRVEYTDAIAMKSYARLPMELVDFIIDSICLEMKLD